MGFGGGGTGSFVLPNHTHTNAIANGGALVGATSLIDLETIDTYFASEYAAVKPIFTQTQSKDTTFSTGSTVVTNITNCAITLQAAGKYFLSCECVGEITSTVVGSLLWQLSDNAVKLDSEARQRSVSTDAFTKVTTTLSAIGASDGNVVRAMTGVTSATNVLTMANLLCIEVDDT